MQTFRDRVWTRTDTHTHTNDLSNEIFVNTIKALVGQIKSRRKMSVLLSDFVFFFFFVVGLFMQNENNKIMRNSTCNGFSNFASKHKHSSFVDRC